MAGRRAGLHTATLPAGTEHAPGCPLCWDHRRDSQVPSCPAQPEADAGAIRQMLQHRGMLGAWLRPRELHQCPQTPRSPLFAPHGLYPSPTAWPHHGSWSRLHPMSIPRVWWC